MPIGTAERPINIKDLILEEPSPEERELSFDPERDLSRESWGRMKEELEKNRRAGHWQNYIFYASRMKLLFPDRIGEWELERDIKGMHYAFDHQQPMPGAKLNMAVGLKVLFPHASDQFHLTDEELWNMGIRRWREVQDELIGGEASWYPRCLKILFPHREGALDISQRDLKTMIDECEMFRQASEIGTENYWLKFAELASSLRILSESGFQALHLDHSTWQTLKQELGQYQQGFTGVHSRVDELLDLALDMKLLAAEKVEVTDKGLEIVMRKPRTDFAPPTPPMPEVRRF